MSAAMKSMNLEKISTLMDKFEKEFEDLDVQTSVMEGAMSQTTATSIPQDAVENLMKQVRFNVCISVYLSIYPGCHLFSLRMLSMFLSIKFYPFFNRA